MNDHRSHEKIIRCLLSSLRDISDFITTKMSQQGQFVICGRFSGKNEQSTAKWLRRLEWELAAQKINDEISSKMLLKSIDLLIIEEAST